MKLHSASLSFLCAVVNYTSAYQVWFQEWRDKCNCLVLQAQRTAEVAKLQSTLDVLQRDTQEYQQAKTQEVSGLEARIRELIQQGNRSAPCSGGSSQKAISKQRKVNRSPGTSRDGAARPQQFGNTAGSDPIVIPSGTNPLDASGNSANSAPNNFTPKVRPCTFRA